jgi:FKBP-type peptidyl-prolyl cis-trans isomerase SlyD
LWRNTSCPAKNIYRSISMIMEITKETVVSLRYIMKNDAGEEIENTMTGPAVQYVHGSGKILPQLEAMLEGLQTGDKRSVTVELPATFHFAIEIDQVRMATPEELEAGSPGAVGNCGPGCCC